MHANTNAIPHTSAQAGETLFVPSHAPLNRDPWMRVWEYEPENPTQLNSAHCWGHCNAWKVEPPLRKWMRRHSLWGDMATQSVGEHGVAFVGFEILKSVKRFCASSLFTDEENVNLTIRALEFLNAWSVKKNRLNLNTFKLMEMCVQNILEVDWSRNLNFQWV